MNYNKLSINGQRVDIAAFGYRKEVVPSCYDVRDAIAAQDIADDACNFYDKSKSILRFSVFLRAMKIARLSPRHLVKWLGRSHEGREAMRYYVRAEQVATSPR